MQHTVGKFLMLNDGTCVYFHFHLSFSRVDIGNCFHWLFESHLKAIHKRRVTTASPSSLLRFFFLFFLFLFLGRGVASLTILLPQLHPSGATIARV